MNTIKFNVNENTLKMFELALSISNENPDNVFEKLAKEYAAAVLQKMQNNTAFHTEVQENEILPQTKAEKKVPLWARRNTQISHQIIKAFFSCEKEGIASRREMKNKFQECNDDKTSDQFENNLNSMGTDKGNSHGHIFDFYGDEVVIAKKAKEVLYRHKNDFLG